MSFEIASGTSCPRNDSSAGFPHSALCTPHFIIVLLLISTPLYAGTISGKALFEGAPGKNKKIDMAADPVCAKSHPGEFFDDRIVVNSNQTLKNVFVYVQEGLEGQTFSPPSQAAELDQEGCW